MCLSTCGEMVLVAKLGHPAVARSMLSQHVLEARPSHRRAVTQCPRCGDALRVIAFITDRHVTAHILEHLGLASDLVPIAPARAPPDDPVSELEFGA